MSEGLAVVRAYRDAVDRRDYEAALSCFSEDIEWVRPGRTIRGLEAVREDWSRPRSDDGPENLDVVLKKGELEDQGDGRVSTWNHQVFRWKETGELAYERHATIEYLIRDGKIARYEVAMADGPPPADFQRPPDRGA